VEKAYLLNKNWLFPSLALPMGLGRMYSPQGYKAAMFFIVSWMVAQGISAGLKTAFSRTRPAVATLTALRIKQVNRAFPSYRAMLSIGESVFESFPSGDSVGAACFSATMYILNAPTWTVLLCVLTAFCRMYFHAHHLLDVSAGLLLGWVVSLTLNALFGIQYFDLLHTGMATVLFIAFIIKLQKLKPQLPAHMRVAGRKGF
jgi:membrane-associated phospholipid phosphatase